MAGTTNLPVCPEASFFQLLTGSYGLGFSPQKLKLFFIVCKEFLPLASWLTSQLVIRKGVVVVVFCTTHTPISRFSQDNQHGTVVNCSTSQVTAVVFFLFLVQEKGGPILFLISCCRNGSIPFNQKASALYLYSSLRNIN
jgi:hypothetical protein